MAKMASGSWTSEAGNDCIVAVHGRLPPSNAEWQSYCGLVFALRNPALTKGVTFTLGGGPNAKQRATLTDIHRKLVIPVDVKGAVISDSTMVRGVITAFAWAGIAKGMRSFSARDVHAGLDYVEIAIENHPAVINLLSKLGAAIDDGNPLAVVV